MVRGILLGLALSLSVVGCGNRIDRGTLPAQLSDAAFWALATDLSEAPGSFSHSDNLVSNEILIPHTLRQLRARGGAYIGVGPEQNFSYIARLEPAMAFVIDIRQENRNLHLLYKALFELSSDRAEFVSRLFSRQPLALDRNASARALFEAYQASSPSAELLAKTAAAVRDRLITTHGLPLSAADLESIDDALTAFHTDGPDISYRSPGGTREQPSYRALMTAPDASGESRSYLAGERAFQFIKALHEKNLIIPVVGDFGRNAGAIARVGGYVRQHGSFVSAFYGSNVQTYLNNQQLLAYCGSLADLPVARGAAFIHNEGTERFRDKVASCARRAGR